MIKLTAEQKQLLESQEWEEQDDGTWLLFAQFAGGVQELKTQEHALEEIESINISLKFKENQENFWKKKKEEDDKKLILNSDMLPDDKFSIVLNVSEIKKLKDLFGSENLPRYIGSKILEKLNDNKSSKLS
jgi:hypothetical protein